MVPPIVTAVAGKLYNPGCVTVRGAAAAAIARAVACGGAARIVVAGDARGGGGGGGGADVCVRVFHADVEAGGVYGDVVVELPLCPPPGIRGAVTYSIEVRGPREPVSACMPSGASFMAVACGPTGGTGDGSGGGGGGGGAADAATTAAVLEGARRTRRRGGGAGARHHASLVAAHIFAGIARAVLRLVERSRSSSGVGTRAVELWLSAISWLRRASHPRLLWSRDRLCDACGVVITITEALCERMGIEAPWDMAVDAPRWTLLHFTAAMGFEGPTERLLLLGADPTRLTRNGHTPLQLGAAYSAAPVIRQRLLQAIACRAEPAPAARR